MKQRKRSHSFIQFYTVAQILKIKFIGRNLKIMIISLNFHILARLLKLLLSRRAFCVSFKSAFERRFIVICSPRSISG
jgi:hypothetical protein